jgi:hypothetical protein
MKFVVLILASIAMVTFVNGSRPMRKDYSPTPYGYVLTKCMHSVPSNSHLKELKNGSTLVTLDNNQGSYLIPKCTSENNHPVLIARNNEEIFNETPNKNPLPPDYDGWLQYTEINVTDLSVQNSFDAFTNYMSVPEIPKAKPQVLFLFPGLQNINWIPKVDPEPKFFDIIQPVLQYPGTSFFAKGWELKSWYVTVNAGAIFSTAINDIRPGDSIFCNMTRTGDDSWVVIGTVNSTGKTTTQKCQNARLNTQPWAYNTVECYGCNGCDTYPSNYVEFTENKLYKNDKLLDLKGSLWKINPRPAAKLMCHEKTVVKENSDTIMYFDQQ